MIRKVLLAVFEPFGAFKSFIISLVSHLIVWSLIVVFDGTKGNGDAFFFIGLFTLMLLGFAIYHLSLSLLAVTGLAQLLAIRPVRISLLLLCPVKPLIFIFYQANRIELSFDIYPALFTSFTILLTSLAWYRLRMYKIQSDL